MDKIPATRKPDPNWFMRLQPIMKERATHGKNKKTDNQEAKTEADWQNSRKRRQGIEAKAEKKKGVRLSDLRRRAGRFSIYTNAIDKDPESVMAVMSKMIIVRAETMFFDKIDYTAISPLFQKIPMGERSPEYELVMENGELLRAERKDP